MSQNYEKLIALLKELFQLDRPDRRASAGALNPSENNASITHPSLTCI